ncbi:restriction endonuclease [Candidatus Solirubrobacter pratensis]|uniref:restriction endonuclease n=1 Tax=Candidatus Solirubrobacter pratensis TaxID=1298857 RepID=UPI0003FD7D8D|nr:restriction endonuclease [Candidatus Solirubrobacter pratensis]
MTTRFIAAPDLAEPRRRDLAPPCPRRAGVPHEEQGTVTDASDLIEDIRLALVAADGAAHPSGASTLRERLVEETRRGLLSGYFDERRFEELVRDVLTALGAADARIVPRQHDVGADIIAQFPVGGLTLVPVHVQVKYWHPQHGRAGVEPIDQLIASMDGVEIGLVVTTTEFEDEARSYALGRAERRPRSCCCSMGRSSAS